MMSLWLSSSSSLFSKSFNGNTKSATPRFRASADVPDFLSVDWLESRRKRPFGPRLSFSAEESVQYQLDALMFNDQPRPDYGVEVMYRTVTSRGFGYSDLGLRKKKPFSLPWFRELVGFGMVIGLQNLFFTTEIVFLVGWHTEQTTMRQGGGSL